MKAAFQGCFLWYHGSQKFSLFVSPKKCEEFSTSSQRMVVFPTPWAWALSPEKRNSTAGPWERAEIATGRQSTSIWVIFLQEEKCFNLLICFVSTQFAAFVLLGWEMVIWDLERICVPEWSQSMLAWRETCYSCCLLWRCCCWLKGACCGLLLKLRESSIERPTALTGGKSTEGKMLR